jgi:hypothetical protein
VLLRGDVHTAWKSATFSPTEGIPLEVRSPVSIRTNVIQKQTEGAASESYSEAFLDISILFGRVDEVSSTVNVILPGQWSEFSFEQIPPGSKPESISKNSTDEPKAIAFMLRYLVSKSFTSQQMRIGVTSPTPLTKTEWANAFAGGYAELPSY